MIYLIRHGQTEFNLARRFQGHLDSPLTRLGERQARAIGLKLSELGLADLPMMVSPLGRTQATADILRAALGHTGPVSVEPRIAEIMIGEWEGMTDEDIELVYPGARDHLDRWDWHFHAPRGESFDAFQGRLSSWLNETLDAGRPVIAVSHGGCSRMLRGLAAGTPKSEFLKLHVPQDALFRLTRGSVEEIACDLAAAGA